MIVGWVAVAALNAMFLTFTQNDDNITARTEIEFAFNELRPQFTNIGLGMPNNRNGSGSFKAAFDGLTALPASMDNPVFISVSGDKLFYAYAQPTDVRLDGEWHSVGGGMVILSKLKLRTSTEMSKLTGLSDGVTDSANSWILFPSLRIPLQITGITSNDLTVDVRTDTLSGDIRGYEEIHLLRVASIFTSGDQLIQRTFETNTAFTDKTIAVNITEVRFDFNINSRLLTMQITARGNSGEARRITEKMTWRIIN